MFFEEEDVFAGTGKKAIIFIYRDVLNYKEYLTFGAKMYQSPKIKSRILVSEKIRNTAVQKAIYGNYRFLPREFEDPANTLIYGNKLIIIIWIEEPTAFVLESKEAVNVYKKYFEVLWKIAKQ